MLETQTNDPQISPPDLRLCQQNPHKATSKNKYLYWAKWIINKLTSQTFISNMITQNWDDSKDWMQVDAQSAKKESLA